MNCPHIDPDYADIGLLRAGASLDSHEQKCVECPACNGRRGINGVYRCGVCNGIGYVLREE